MNRRAFLKGSGEARRFLREVDGWLFWVVGLWPVPAVAIGGLCLGAPLVYIMPAASLAWAGWMIVIHRALAPETGEG